MVQIMKRGGYHGRVGFFLFATPALGFLFTLFECLGTIIIISGSGPAISGFVASGRGCRGHRSFVVSRRRTAIIFIRVVFTEFRPDAGNGSWTYLLLFMLKQSWWRRRAAWLVSGCLTWKKTKTKEFSISILFSRVFYFLFFRSLTFPVHGQIIWRNNMA